MRKKLLLGCGAFVALVLLSVSAVLYLLIIRVDGDYFDSNGVRIHYTDEGAGEPVILVHGVGANADWNWRRTGVTRALSKHFRVIAFDLRGHGLSEKPAEPEKYGIQMVEDAVRLMDHLGIERAHVAGYSLGGFLLQRLLVLHPDRIQSAAICAAGWKDPEDPTPLPSPYRSPEEQPKPRALQASVFALDSSTSVFNRVRSWIGDQFMSRPVKKALKATYPELAVLRPDLEAIHTPSMCIIGSKDGFRYLAEDLRRHMHGLEFVEVAGANHFTLPFYPQFKCDLVRFLAAHPMAATSTREGTATP